METASKILYEGGQGEIVEKKSRFIANIFPVTTEEEALEKITAMRKKYYDARHNCFAYILTYVSRITIQTFMISEAHKAFCILHPALRAPDVCHAHIYSPYA